MPERPRCEIGVACREKPEEEVVVIQEAQIAGDLWVHVCTECAEILTYIREREQARANGGGGERNGE